MANIDGVKLPDNREFNIKDSISGYSSKVSSATDGHLAGLDASGELTDSGVVGADVVTKVSGGTTGNLPKLDANGKIVDSGILYSDVVTKVTGGTTDDIVKLDANGKIADAGKKVIDLAGMDKIAYIEATTTVSRASGYAVGDYVFVQSVNKLYKITSARSQNQTIVEGTSATEVTIGGQLTALDSKTTPHSGDFTPNTGYIPYLGAKIYKSSDIAVWNVAWNANITTVNQYVEVGTLPVGFRPKTEIYASLTSISVTTVTGSACMYIQTNGKVSINVTNSGTWVAGTVAFRTA